MSKARISARSVQRPASVSHFGVNLLAGALGLGFLAWRQSVFPDLATDNGLQTGLLIATMIALHALWRMRVHRNPSAGLDWDGHTHRDHSRVLFKLLGLALTLALIASAYWLFPEYHGSFYTPFWAALKSYGLPMLALAPIYFWWLDGHLRQPDDAYWHLGRAPFHGVSTEGRRLIAAHLAGWAVKGFFMPLMVAYVGQEVRGAHNAWLALPTGGYAPFELLFHLSFTVDLLFCVLGYAMTLRIFDAHIRWAEPTALGWLVALACYQPFFSVLENQYLHYQDGLQWGQWLSHWPGLKFIWAAALVTLLAIYAMSTIAFGLRFSNLTARGIITGGPYRFSKHPAYVSKNISWWMISIPFIALTPAAALSNCLHLLLINGIYFLRARTEESHLSRDPDYVRYALWINQHGLLARLNRWLPLLRYHPPVGLKS